MALLEQLRNASFATAQKELDSLRQFAAAQVSSNLQQHPSMKERSAFPSYTARQMAHAGLFAGFHRDPYELGPVILCSEAAAGAFQSDR